MADPGGDAAGAGERPAVVEVVYALPDTQAIVEVSFEPGLTAGEAVARSALAGRYPDIASQPLALGRHGVRIDSDDVLTPGDRIEILRPLVADPRRMRFEKVSAGTVMGRGGPRRND